MSDVLEYTPIDEIPKLRQILRDGFASGKMRSIAYRKEQLLQLGYLLQDNIERFQAAFALDLGRPNLETNFLELGTTISEVMEAYKSVEKWAKPDKPAFNFNFAAMSPHTRKEPKGVVLIISPFNYPVNLCLGPLAGALAAGNAVLMKPSELTPNVTALVTELVPQYLDPTIVRVVNGAIPETTKVLELQWDHILYTGSGNVAKIVAAAAAKHLTPLTLELGGKSPVVIDPNCDMKFAAKRILWGKVVNSGQTCVAPDYILVPRSKQDELSEAFKEAYAEFYPQGPDAGNSYSRIVTTNHFDRLNGLLDRTKGEVVVGGDKDREKKYLAPTVVKDVKADDSLMEGELFGPILPIVPVDDVQGAIRFINERDHPLALYVFSDDAKFKAQVFDSTQSGAAVANELLVHVAATGLPFGGVGPSGYGAHTGKHSFDTFSHHRASLDSPRWVDWILGARYPPYNDKKQKKVNGLVMKTIPYPRPSGKGRPAPAAPTPAAPTSAVAAASTSSPAVNETHIKAATTSA